MTINFYINIDKRCSNPEKAIFCYIRYSSKTITLHTGERIIPKYWDGKSQKAKRAYIGHPELNDYLEKYKERIKEIIRKARIENPLITFEELSEAILREVKNKSRYDFFEVFDIFIEIRKPIVSKATTTKFTTLKNHIKDFEDKSKIKVAFESINPAVFDQLHSYFLSIGLSNNTVHKNMQLIKSFLNWAYEGEYTKNDKFQKYESPQWIEVDSIALTRQDLTKIHSCSTLSDRLQKVRDLFLFQLYTGQRFSDISSFKKSDVKNEVWYLRQTKTKKVMEIPLIQPALEILKKYDYSLPPISNQKMNQYLKELGEEVGLKDTVTIRKFKGAEVEEKQFHKYQLLTTHTARRTFVSLASYEGVNQQVVKSYTGHGSDKLVNTYFKKNNSESRRIIEDIFCN